MKDKAATQRKNHFAKQKKKKQTDHVVSTAIRDVQTNSAETQVPADNDCQSPVASTSSPEAKKRKLANAIATQGIKTLIIKKKSGKKSSVKKKTKPEMANAVNAVIAQLGSNESMITPRFANAHPYGLSSFESSYALCDTPCNQKPIA